MLRPWNEVPYTVKKMSIDIACCWFPLRHPTQVNHPTALVAFEIYDMVITGNIGTKRIVIGLERGVGKDVGLETSRLKEM
jgi:hypothetical protein